MSGHQATVPAVVAEYVRRWAPGAPHPVIVAEYREAGGWSAPLLRKRVSPSWCRKLRRDGVTVIGVALEPVDRRLAYRGRVADFRIEQVVR